MFKTVMAGLAGLALCVICLPLFVLTLGVNAVGMELTDKQVVLFLLFCIGGFAGTLGGVCLLSFAVERMGHWIKGESL